jgi:hypothetical protein
LKHGALVAAAVLVVEVQQAVTEEVGLLLLVAHTAISYLKHQT